MNYSKKADSSAPPFTGRCTIKEGGNHSRKSASLTVLPTFTMLPLVKFQ